MKKHWYIIVAVALGAWWIYNQQRQPSFLNNAGLPPGAMS